MKLQNFLGMNLLVRIKNPVFWFELAIALFLPILTYFGAEWNELTSWGALGGLLWEALKNPVVVGAMILSVWNALSDPTTPGFSDRKEILSLPANEKKGE